MLDEHGNDPEAAIRVLLARLGAPVKAKAPPASEAAMAWGDLFVAFVPMANYIPLLREAIAGEPAFVERKV